MKFNDFKITLEAHTHVTQKLAIPLCEQTAEQAR